MGQREGKKRRGRVGGWVVGFWNQVLSSTNRNYKKTVTVSHNASNKLINHERGERECRVSYDESVDYLSPSLPMTALYRCSALSCMKARSPTKASSAAA